MKYKTLSLSYCNGEHNLIMGMSEYGWGLINKINPDYDRGNIYAYYTFAGSNDAPDVDCDFKGDVCIKEQSKL